MTNQQIVTEYPNLKKHKENHRRLKDNVRNLQQQLGTCSNVLTRLLDITEIHENCALKVEETDATIFIDAVGDDNTLAAEVWKKEKKICYLKNGRVVDTISFSSDAKGARMGKDWVAKKVRG